MIRARWIVATSYHPDPEQPLRVRGRLSVIGPSGVIWIGTDSPAARRAAARLAAHLNRKTRREEAQQ